MTHCLIVDDIFENLYMLRVILESQGYQVTEAAHGQEALDRARQNPPDLVISDILMPEMDGFALLRAWRADERLLDIPFIFYTATYTDPSDRSFALHLGADLFLVKPMDPDELLREMKNVLAKAQQGRQPSHAPDNNEALVNEYNQTIVRKLEKKMRDLEQEMARRRKMERELRASEERLKLAVKSGSVGVWDWNLSENEFYMEPWLQHLLGLDLGQDGIRYEQFHAKIHEEDRDHLSALLHQAKEGLLPQMEVQYRVHTQEGNTRWFLRRARLMTIDHQRRLIGVEIDVTEDVVAQEELLMLGQALRGVREFVCITDVQGRFLYTNKSLEKEMDSQWKQNDVLGLFPEAERLRVIHLMKEALEALEEKQMETVLWSQSKGEIPVLLSLSLGGEGKSLTWILSNLMELKEKEKQLRVSQKMETIGTMVSGIAHDFNNILLAIYGNVDMALVQEPPQVDVVKHHLQQIKKASSRASMLVKQLLTLSRGQELEMKPIQIAPILKEVLKLVQAAGPATIEFRCETMDEDCVVLGDAIQIHQLMMNLCTNAIHAMEPKGGILTLRAKQLDVHNGIHGPVPQGSYYHLAVEDTGHGIKEEFLEKIFEPFFSTKPPPLGTGLGLSVAHGIVKNHKGEIAVKSTLGQGACFDVYLPRCDSVSALETARQEVLFYGRETILLVDDEPMLLQVFEEMLQALGYHTLSCFSGAEAQALLRTGKEPVHLVISDQTMPGMTGLELAGHLASLNPAPPVILCTGNRDALIRNLKGHDGIKEVVAKPFDMAAISATIRQVLEEVPPVK